MMSNADVNNPMLVPALVEHFLWHEENSYDAFTKAIMCMCSGDKDVLCNFHRLNVYKIVNLTTRLFQEINQPIVFIISDDTSWNTSVHAASNSTFHSFSGTSVRITFLQA